MVACSKAYKSMLDTTEDAVALSQAVKALDGNGWFDFEKLPPAPAEAKAAVAANQEQPKPTVIVFNEATGRPENAQETAQKKEKEGQWITMPCGEWLKQAVTQDMGKREAYGGAALLVLQAKHTAAHKTWGVSVQQHTLTQKTKVVTSVAVAAGQLSLWPCVPKQSKVLTQSQHPDRVQILVWEKGKEEEAKVAFYVQPEVNLPDGKTCAEVEATDPEQREWKWTGKETMHPLWALTRMTPEELGARNATKAEQGRLRFNVHFETKDVNIVVCGRVLAIRIPTITNMVDLEVGEELVMECAPKKKREVIASDWRADAKKQKLQEHKHMNAPKVAFDSTGRQEI